MSAKSRPRPRSVRKQPPLLPAGLAEEERPFVHDEIVRGIKAQKVKELIDGGVLSAKQVFRIIPERTFSRRLANREMLKVPESDAVGRLLRVTAAAKKTFGDSGFAREWLGLPNPALKDRVPMEMAETDAGAREVEAVLTRIAYGDYT